MNTLKINSITKKYPFTYDQIKNIPGVYESENFVEDQEILYIGDIHPTSGNRLRCWIPIKSSSNNFAFPCETGMYWDASKKKNCPQNFRRIGTCSITLEIT